MPVKSLASGPKHCTCFHWQSPWTFKWWWVKVVCLKNGGICVAIFFFSWPYPRWSDFMGVCCDFVMHFLRHIQLNMWCGGMRWVSFVACVCDRNQPRTWVLLHNSLIQCKSTWCNIDFSRERWQDALIIANGRYRRYWMPRNYVSINL